ncbi:hypothetical protein BT96DRAFT_1007954 [Gymnopus androsaceus JB14]|uniref:CCHC-type domain-containing protein n=1 Tax=Gymnopus androsaceus JB14 TaxID=1447944 RepID=A0A6A4GG63_9AGAR|nr:hypothetical protein BT96DRAFT_1007954 [Gymnopus androsaceus JB14]
MTHSEPVLLRRVSSQRNPSLLDRMSAAPKRSRSSSPEASEDESSSLYKKPKMDKSQFYFVQVDRDINETVRLIRSQPHLPNLPSSQWKNVLLNSYVEFDTILSKEFNADGEEDTIDGKENIVPCNSSRSKTSRRVIQFDRAARRYIGKQRGVLFDATWKFENFVRAAVRGPGYVNSKGESSASSEKLRRKETCRNWNHKRCHNDPCPRDHKCSKCGSREHPAADCTSPNRKLSEQRARKMVGSKFESLAPTLIATNNDDGQDNPVSPSLSHFLPRYFRGFASVPAPVALLNIPKSISSRWIKNPL